MSSATASIQFRLEDGSSVRLQFAASQTLLDAREKLLQVRDMVGQIQPVVGVGAHW
jgi:hypothetical protein